MFKGFQIATKDVDLGSIKNFLRETAALGCNAIRYQIVAPDPRYMGPLVKQINYNYWSFGEYENWWWSQIKNIRDCCDVILNENLNIQIIVDCHSPYGGTTLEDGKTKHLIALSAENDRGDRYRRGWESFWLEAIKTLHFYPCIAGYDLCNEPAAETEDWLYAATRLAKKIRQLERNENAECKWIFVSTPSGRIEKFREMKKIPVKKISYQAHVYHSGPINERKMKRKLVPAFRFARRENVPLYFGEIGSDRKNGDKYVTDFFQTILPILHENKNCNHRGGGYTIHAWKESNRFDYEGTQAMEVIKAWVKA